MKMKLAIIKAIALIFFLVICSAPNRAQSFTDYATIQWCNVSEDHFPDLKTPIVGKNDTVYTIKPEKYGSIKPDYLLAEYGPDFRFIKEQSVSISSDNNPIYIRGGLFLGDRLWLIGDDVHLNSVTLVKAYQECNTYLISVNRGSLQIKNEPKFKFTAKIFQEYTTGVAYKLDMRLYNFISSAGKTKMAFYTNPNVNKTYTENFKAAVIDADGSTLWSDSLILPKGIDYARVNKVIVDDQGNLYAVLVGHFPNNNSASEYSYYLISRQYNASSFESTPIAFDFKFITDLSIGLDTMRNRVFACGYYSPYNHITASGAFELIFNSKSLTIEKKSQKEFDEKMKIAVSTEYDLSKNKEEIFTPHIADILIEPDGSLFFAGQVFQWPKNNPTLVTVGRDFEDPDIIYRNYESIIATHINEQGDINANSAITLRQISNFTGTIQFRMQVNNHNAFILYNDHPKNTVPLAFEKTNIYDGNLNIGIPKIAIINEDGEVKIFNLLPQSSQSMVVATNNHLDSSPDKMLIDFPYNKMDKIGWLNFK